MDAYPPPNESAPTGGNLALPSAMEAAVADGSDLDTGDAAERLRQVVIVREQWLVMRATAVTGDPALAEDAVQQALASLWQTRERWPASDDELRAVVTGAVVNHALMIVRSRRRHRAAMSRAAAHATDPGTTPGHAARLAESELAGLVWQLALDLPEQQRDVVLARFGRGLSVSETATDLAMPRSTVSTVQQRALRQLRGLMRQQGVRVPAFGGAAWLAMLLGDGLPTTTATTATATAATGITTADRLRYVLEVVLMTTTQTRIATVAVLLLLLAAATLLGWLTLPHTSPASRPTKAANTLVAQPDEAIAGIAPPARPEIADQPAAPDSSAPAANPVKATDIPADEPATLNRFTGRLVHQPAEFESAPAAGVKIVTDPDSQVLAITDADGRYDFEHPAPVLDVHADDPRFLATGFTVRQGVDQLHTLSRPWVLELHVFTPDGQPADGVRVFGWRQAGQDELLSVKTLGPGVLEVVAESDAVYLAHPGYCGFGLFASQGSRCPSSLRIAVRLGGIPACRLIARDEQGQPVAGLAPWQVKSPFRMTRTDPGSPIITGTTDSDGVLTIPGSAIERNEPWVELRGDAASSPPVQLPTLSPAVVKLSDGEDPLWALGTIPAGETHDVYVPIQRTGGVIGRVQLADVKRRGDEPFRIRHEGNLIQDFWDVPMQPELDADGAFRFEHLKVGRWTIELEAVVTDSRLFPGYRVEFEITPGGMTDLGLLAEVAADLEFRTVRVTVEDHHGKPVDAELDAWIVDDFVELGSSGASGSVTVKVPQQADRISASGEQLNGSIERPADGWPTQVVIRAGPSGDCAVHILDASGAPFAGLTVGVQKQGSDTRTIETTDTSGSIWLTSVRAGQQVCLFDPASATPTEGQHLWVTISDTLELAVRLPDSIAVTRGVVFGSDGQVLAHAKLKNPAGGASYKPMCIADQNGRFALFGDHRMLQVAPDARAIGAGASVPVVRLEDGSVEVRLQLLAATGRLTLRVRHESGYVAGTSGLVRFEPVDAAGQPLHGVYVPGTVYVANRGVVAVNLPPGHWKLRWVAIGESVLGLVVDDLTVAIREGEELERTMTVRSVRSGVTCRLQGAHRLNRLHAELLGLRLRFWSGTSLIEVEGSPRCEVWPVTLPPGDWAYELTVEETGELLASGDVSVGSGQQLVTIPIR